MWDGMTVDVAEIAGYGLGLNYGRVDLVRRTGDGLRRAVTNTAIGVESVVDVYDESGSRSSLVGRSDLHRAMVPT